MQLQHSDIGFYADMFSLLFITIIAALSFAALMFERKTTYQKHSIDAAWWFLSAIVALSYSISGIGWGDYQPVSFIIGGGLAFLAARSHNMWNRIMWLLGLLVILLVLLAMWQWQNEQQLCSVFSNPNYFAGFLGCTLPILVGARLERRPRSGPFVLAYATAPLLLCLTIAIARSRSALLGMGAGLFVLYGPMVSVLLRKGVKRLPRNSVLRFLFIVGVLLGSSFVLLVTARQLYLFEPLSGAGRLLIFSVANHMMTSVPLSGVGFSNLANTYNLYQADYFAHSRAGVPLRMAADACRHAFNEPLEVAAELGVPGLVLLLLFAGLILNEVWKVVKRNSASIVRAQAARATKPDYMTLGMAGAVVCFMVMSLFHFPRKVVPTWLVFNYALAWVVTANQQHEQGVNESKRKLNTWVILAWRMFWLLAFLGSTALVPLYVKNYLDARHWIAAQEQIFAGNVASAYAGYTGLYAKLKWSGRFCAYYGDAIMIAAQSTNEQVCLEANPPMRALELYEKAKYTYPDPYMFENLAVAYLRIAEGTSFPVRVQTRYRMETPAQTIARTVREWRCGTKLFFEPPPDELSQSECIGRAIDYLTLVSNILPWRLTSRWYLAQVYRDVGDYSNAVKYAQLVVNIPMKKDTPQGRAFKRKAQKMLNELGVPCDDPGLIVFNIRDRRTWNEGKW